MFKLDGDIIKPVIVSALQEDIGTGDITTEFLVGVHEYAHATVTVNEPCCVAGIPLAKIIFHEVDPELEVIPLVDDGACCEPGEVLRISGRAASILVAERTVLNFLQRLSGIATLTRSYVQKVEKYGTAIMDTRKTMPTMRYLEKYAVRVGGGVNHRYGLYDAVLIKENHMAIAGRKGRDYIGRQLEKLRSFSKKQIIIEVHHLDELNDILVFNPDVILLDNFSVDELKEAVLRIGRKVLAEASGNISIDTVEDVAATGVDRISIGRLTHSYNSIDMSLEITPREY